VSGRDQDSTLADRLTTDQALGARAVRFQPIVTTYRLAGDWAARCISASLSTLTLP
jgi:hypothetical protein